MQFIRYVGPAHVRVISADDWRRAGVTDMGHTEWGPFNNFSVPIESFSDKALRVAIEPDPYLIVVGGEKYEPRLVPEQTGEQAHTGASVDVARSVGIEVTGAPGGSAPTTVTTGPGSTAGD